jgi:hypothetical protein
MALRPELFARQGHVAATWRCRNGKRFGPYYRLAYRENGRQHSIYLGRASEQVEMVRRQLELLQRSRIERRAIRRLENHIRASLRLEKLHLAALLRPYGLRLKGFEVRGWRFSPLRRFLPPRRSFSPQIPSLASKRHVLHPNRDPPPIRLARFLAARDGEAKQ